VIISELCDNEIIEELSAGAYECVYEHSGTKGLFPVSPESVIIICELVRNLGNNAAYDLLKFTLITVITKIRSKLQKNRSIEFIVFHDDKKDVISIPSDIELTEDQQERLVDACIKKFLS